MNRRVLTEEQVAEMRRLRSEGATIRDLVERFGVCKATVMRWSVEGAGEEMNRRQRERWRTDPEYRARRMRQTVEYMRRRKAK